MGCAGRAREREQGDHARSRWAATSARTASRGTAKLVLSLYEAIPDITLQELRAALPEKGPVLRFRLSFADGGPAGPAFFP